MIACGSGEDRLYIYHLDTGRTDSMLVNQAKSDPTILWSVRFLSPSQWAHGSSMICRIVTGDSRGSVQIWDVSKRIMLENHKAHEGDVLTLSVFSFLDASGGEQPSAPQTMIVSGGVDAKVCEGWHDDP